MSARNKNRITRREFIKGTALLGGTLASSRLLSALAVPFPRKSFAGYVPAADPWAELPAILARIKPPSFPDREFDVTKFGAIGDNKADCTEAFQKAIAACHAGKGGRVLVPAGEFITGAIRLKSNVNLHISSGATVRFARDPVNIRWSSLAGKGLS